MDPQPVAALAARRPRGRPTKAVRTPLANFLIAELANRRLTRHQLAAALQVDAAAISRLINGQTKTITAFSADDLCRALELHAVKRRRLLALVAGAGIAFAARITLLRHTSTLIDLAGDHLETLYRLLESGQAAFVAAEAGRWYQRLLQEYPETTDPQIATLQARFGMLHGIGQESSVPWRRRSGIVLASYTDVLERIVYAMPLSARAVVHVNLLERRAPIYRELRRYDAGLRDFDDAIALLPYLHDPALHVTLWRNRAHISAVQGNEQRWLQDVQRARAAAERLTGELRTAQLGLVDYSLAEGYKRLALFASDAAIRRRYSQQALDLFAAGEVNQHFYWRLHGLVAGVSAAQCLLWIDPHETIARLEALTAQADTLYPAWLDKIHHALQAARRRLGQHAPRPRIFV